jgi:hypothetical protein
MFCSLSFSRMNRRTMQTTHQPPESQTKQPRAPAPTKRRCAALHCELRRGAVRWVTRPAGFLLFFFFFSDFSDLACGVAGFGSGFVSLPLMGRCFRFWVCEVV